MEEIELKFRIPPADHARLRHAAALAGVRPARKRLVTTYLDTAEGLLESHGMALRLRRAGARWIEGLKAGPGAAGALHTRGEWEFRRRDAGIDLARYAETPLAQLPAADTLHHHLRPVFTVDMQRTTWQVAPGPGTRLEIALDVGEVRGEGRAEAISEVEIECLEGDAAAAFDLAAKLLEEIELRPSAVTKAQRGYRLLREEAPAPAKAPAVRLEPGMTLARAARAVVGAGLAQLMANDEGLLASPDPEYVHQTRVALRRMRSALRLFRDAIGAERAGRWRDELAGLARALGAARDWDVLALETLPPLLAAYGDAALARRLAARAARRRRRERDLARAAMRAPAYGRCLLALTRWLWEPPAPPAQGESEDLAAFARRVIRKRHKRLLRDARRIATLDSAQRHQVRIDAKRLRYSTDALASLLPARRVAPYLEALSELQDALGRSNDAATAARLVRELAPPEGFAAFARGWLAARGEGDALLHRLLVDKLRAARRAG